MFFPALSATVAQAAQILPEKLRDKLGLQQSPASPSQDPAKDHYAKAKPSVSRSTMAQPQGTYKNTALESKAPPAVEGLSGAEKPVQQSPSLTQNPISEPGTAVSPSVEGGSPGASPNLPNGNTANPTQPPVGTAAAGARPSAVPGGNIKPLTVDEMFKRMSKQFQPKKAKFSLTPEEIRYNPIRKEQECLDRMVKALPWNDEDVINPFHTDSCNITE